MSAYYGYIIAFLAMCSYASLPPIAKKIASSGFEGFSLIFVNSIFLLFFSFIAILCSGQNFDVLKKISLSTWGWVALWAFINFVGFAFYIWAINKIPVVNYQIMYLASPLIAALIAFFLLNEGLELKQLLGGLLVAAGIFITIR